MSRTLCALELDVPMPSRFRVDAPFQPAGDQPRAIADSPRASFRPEQQVLAGVTERKTT